MSILVEIAEKADVPVEGVVRVLTREPVSEAVKERVLAVLDDLTPEQTRAVQRFALAALHDVLLRPDEGADPAGLPATADEAPPALPAATGADAAFVQLGSVLGELAEAVRDLRRETDEERRERVDDLAVIIDLITTGWQGLDARLGRIERQVSRLEAGRREPVVISPPRVAPPAAEPAAAPVEPRQAQWAREAPDRRHAGARRGGDRHARGAADRLGRARRVAARRLARVGPHDGDEHSERDGACTDLDGACTDLDAG